MQINKLSLIQQQHRLKYTTIHTMMVKPSDKLCTVSYGVLLLCLALSTSWASYTRQQCPGGINHMMEACKCKENIFGVYIICDLAGDTYERLPVFGQVNKTVISVTLRNGGIRELPRHVVGNLSVSYILFYPFMSNVIKWYNNGDSMNW